MMNKLFLKTKFSTQTTSKIRHSNEDKSKKGDSRR